MEALFTLLLIFGGLHLLVKLGSGTYGVYHSHCQNKCITFYAGGGAHRSMEKTLRCKDCYPKLAESIKQSRDLFPDPKIKFEIISVDTAEKTGG